MKIKFLDNPEEIIEVITAQQLANTFFKLMNREHLEMIIALGFRSFSVKGADLSDFVKLWDDLDYTALPCLYLDHGDLDGFREFEIISPETETDLTKQLETLQGAQAFIQTFDKVNPSEAGEAWWRELKKVDQLPQTQEALNDQLLKLRVIANKFGLYDAADYCKTSNF